MKLTEWKPDVYVVWTGLSSSKVKGTVKDVCGRLLHNVLHYSCWVLRDRRATGADPSPLRILKWFNETLHKVRVAHLNEHLFVKAAKQQEVRKGWKYTTRFLFFFCLCVRRRKKKILLRWTGDKARFHSCYDNSYTPISLFLREYCAVIFDEQEHTRTHTHTHAHTHAHTHVYK